MSRISPTELSFLRLLERTKRLTKENLAANVWKVSAATNILTNLILQLQSNEECNDIIDEYRREVIQLKLLAEAENKITSEESLKVVEKIPRLFPDLQIKPEEKEEAEIKESSAGLRATQRSIYRSDLRKQLFSSKNARSRTSGDNEDELFMKNEKLEENLANDLLSMTRSLKTVMSAANDVIKEDNMKLIRMQKQVEDNKTSLETENTRLEHHAYKCGFDCMRIFIVIFVFWTFIMMVMMMKVFPKRYSS